MAVTRTQIGIAVGAGVLLVMVFVGYLWWLTNQGPVLARSEDHDPLTGLPVSIKMNPLRDRSTERAANKFIREMRDGHCDDVLAKWEHDYHKKYAKYICESETQHPLISLGTGGVGRGPAADHSALPRQAPRECRPRSSWNRSGPLHRHHRK